MLVLATVPVHLANQHFYGTLLGRREGVCKKSTLCTLVKMLKIWMVPNIINKKLKVTSFYSEKIQFQSGGQVSVILSKVLNF